MVYMAFAGRILTRAVQMAGYLTLITYWTTNPPSYAAGLEYNLGGVHELDGYCRLLGYLDVSLDGNSAYDWHCVENTGGRVSISMDDACDWQYATRGLRGFTKNFHDVSSWRCYGGSIAQ